MTQKATVSFPDGRYLFSKDADWNKNRDALGLVVGSSDAAVIMGEVGSVVELYYQKIGLEPYPEETERMLLGKFKEKYIVEVLQTPQYMGVPIGLCNDTYANARTPWLIATPDAVFSVDGELCILEIKSTSGLHEEVWSEGIPRRVYWQLVHQALVTGCRRVAAAAEVSSSYLGLEGCKILYHVLEGEIPQEDLDRYFEAASLFHAHCVSGEPPVDNTERGTKARMQYHSSKGGAVKDGDARDAALIREIDSVSKDIEALERRKEELKQLVIASMEGARALVVDGFKATLTHVEGKWIAPKQEPTLRKGFSQFRLTKTKAKG